VKDRPGGLFSYEGNKENIAAYDMLDDYHVKMNHALGHLRRYILIVVSNTIPIGKTAYASYSDGKYVYYIDDDDEISKKNFHLLSLFLTMMAIPPQSGDEMHRRRNLPV
jgi:hypothetical protein